MVEQLGNYTSTEKYDGNGASDALFNKDFGSYVNLVRNGAATNIISNYYYPLAHLASVPFDGHMDIDPDIAAIIAQWTISKGANVT